MKKQKLFSLALAVLLLPACSQPPQKEAPAPTAAPVQEAEPAQSAAPPQAGEEQDEVKPFAPTATIEETVLVEESDIKITATDLAYTLYEVELGLSIENNTAKNLSFHSGTVAYSCNSVNGYMVSGGYLNADVAAGKKTRETVTFDAAELGLMGIQDIADIEIGFHITDDSYDDYLLTGPCRLETSLAERYDYAADTYRAAVADGSGARQLGFSVLCDTEEEVYDQKDVRVLSRTLIGNDDGEQVLLVEVQNDAAEGVYVSVGDVSLNGLRMAGGTWSSDWVGPGKRRIMELTLSSMLEEPYRTMFGLREVGEVRCFVTLKNEDYEDLTLPQELAFAVPGADASFDATGAEVYRENGIRILSKGLAPDAPDFSDDIHLLLLVENGSDEALLFDVNDGTLSVNGYMTDFYCYGMPVPAGGSGMLDVELPESYLEENGIQGIDDIAEIELAFEIRDENYKAIAEPTVTIEPAPHGA